MRAFLATCALALFLAASGPVATPALAIITPDEMLADPALEKRARTISKGLRCLVCQNQSIDDSEADLARDLRRVVRERLVLGESDQAVMAHIRARYGDYVLLSPPVRLETYALWGAPVILFGLGAIMLMVFYRGRRRAGQAEAAPLTASEQTRLDVLLGDDGKGDR